MSDEPTIVGLGEILWDLLPSSRRLGGAPANFAYCSHLLGSRALIACRIGDDELGRELRQTLADRALSQQYLQTDSIQPTGTVHVQLNNEGQPTFEITQPAAWDFLEFTEHWKSLARAADAVCFGSLAQRSQISRETIMQFLDSTGPGALRVFDVNLRQSFYSAEIIESSLQRANVIKLNHLELPALADILHLDSFDPVFFCRKVLERFQMRLVCITRGADGSLLVSTNDAQDHPGFRVKVKDTVGAGDAFTAGLVHELLRDGSLSAMNDTANRMGAWVASQVGAMPAVPRAGLRSALAELASDLPIANHDQNS
jgi:fructokinase